MLFGFTGAHRSGKTTLASAVAEELSIEFYATSTSQVAKDLGFDAVAPMTLHDRLTLQRALLANHIAEISKRSRPLVTDRTPLDFLCYLACEFNMTSGKIASRDTLVQARTFTNECLLATKTYYESIIYLAPLPQYIAEEGKPDENPIFQRHFDLTLLGSLASFSDTINNVRIFTPDFDTRLATVHEYIVGRLDHLSNERKTAHWLS